MLKLLRKIRELWRLADLYVVMQLLSNSKSWEHRTLFHVERYSMSSKGNYWLFCSSHESAAKADAEMRKRKARDGAASVRITTIQQMRPIFGWTSTWGEI